MNAMFKKHLTKTHIDLNINFNSTGIKNKFDPGQKKKKLIDIKPLKNIENLFVNTEGSNKKFWNNKIFHSKSNSIPIENLKKIRQHFHFLLIF